MNKYAAIGLIREAVAGRKIAVITDNPRDTTHATGEFASLLDGADDVVRIVRGVRSGNIIFEGSGRIDVLTKVADLCGRSVDVVYLDGDLGHSILHTEIVDHVLPALRGSERGEIVRA